MQCKRLPNLTRALIFPSIASGWIFGVGLGEASRTRPEFGDRRGPAEKSSKKACIIPYGINKVSKA
jgi:hypothetical protein